MGRAAASGCSRNSPQRRPVRKIFSKASVTVEKGALPKLVAEVNELARTWKKRLGKHGPPSTTTTTIRLASDCSGYGSDLIAARLLGLQNNIKIVMTSELDPRKRHLHEAVRLACGWPPVGGEMCNDMMRRNDLKAPRADCYVAGFPCPSFSNLGKRRGARDGRGLVTLKGLKYIAAQRPRAVLLEQVSAILQKIYRKVRWTTRSSARFCLPSSSRCPRVGHGFT